MRGHTLAGCAGVAAVVVAAVVAVAADFLYISQSTVIAIVMIIE